MKTCYYKKLNHTKIAIGDVGMFRNSEDKALITRINVPREFRGQGHAGDILKQITRDADAEGITLILETIPGDGNNGLQMDDLVRWYERHGFRVTEQTPLGSIEMERPPCSTL